MKTYIVFVKKGAAATGSAVVKIKADEHYLEGAGHLVFNVGGELIARFAAGEWVGVVEDSQLLSA